MLGYSSSDDEDNQDEVYNDVEDDEISDLTFEDPIIIDLTGDDDVDIIDLTGDDDEDSMRKSNKRKYEYEQDF